MMAASFSSGRMKLSRVRQMIKSPRRGHRRFETVPGPDVRTRPRDADGGHAREGRARAMNRADHQEVAMPPEVPVIEIAPPGTGDGLPGRTVAAIVRAVHDIAYSHQSRCKTSYVRRPA
jgi:hypothetical protein